METTIKFTITETEKRYIENLIKQKDLSMNEFVKYVLFSEKKETSSTESEEYLEDSILKLQKFITNNLNLLDKKIKEKDKSLNKNNLQYIEIFIKDTTELQKHDLVITKDDDMYVIEKIIGKDIVYFRNMHDNNLVKLSFEKNKKDIKKIKRLLPKTEKK